MSIVDHAVGTVAAVAGRFCVLTPERHVRPM